MQSVGPYRMFNLIRAGATYEIWVVRPMADNEVYAMKWLPMGPQYTRATVAGLRHEHVVGQSLNHPNVIQTHEFGTCRDGAYLTMELFRFPNLKQRVHAGVQKLFYYVPQIVSRAAAGLAHMHEKGWVHRDIKPDNFLVDDDHDVRLIDFNLSRKAQGRLGRIFGGRTKVQGTPSYIAPEQIRGQPCDYRTDIYSFGCVIFEMLHGKPPFTATSANELLNKHLRTKPPLVTVYNKNVDPSFADLLQQMMAKDPKDRPDSLSDLTREIKLYDVFRTPPKPPAEAQAAS
jgi:eukaryotic-like serine/threonine-protein kinase